MELVAAIVLAAVILFYLRMTVLALNHAERYYTSFTLILSVAVVCIPVLDNYGAPSSFLTRFCCSAARCTLGRTVHARPWRGSAGRGISLRNNFSERDMAVGISK